ncbi:exopolysaccharide biosynthesis polyprenyl glycosylphosphotransferase [Brevundimonas sp. 2R-24]|uniref:Exopolysaccharide biosynthesis polyprenyl glycosylphosphotransferase n=1 Tax=Peiella sedimenti TaxID=3061083 RepID=A0ABT8SP31_9CAUL|nr:exopolysaccharide biosynthesis polyprenyl glycosylphosphotransferase [Caulobacteraceae bacterium XZ-24]
MTALAPADPKPDARPRSAAGLETLARHAEALAAQRAGERRGPFRPARLTSARDRQTLRLSSHYFRLYDWMGLAAVTLIGAHLALNRDLMGAAVAELLPFLLAAGLALALLRTLGLYAFRAHEGLPEHLMKTTGAMALAGLAGIALAAPFGFAGSLGGWTAAALLVTAGLHALWWSQVRSWRRSGALTPNIVIVGATRRAQTLIEAALARRDLNVLGVFDDRLSRAPRDVAGVPVLGNVEDLLGHRMMPAVDHIVLAVDPGARSRTRQIYERLSSAPQAVSMVVDDPARGGAGQAEALRRLAEAPLARLEQMNEERRAFAKRLQDLLLGALILIAALPVMAVTAVLVKLDSPGPAFFRQRRHGFNNEEIVVWKFRTMRVESADARAERQVTADDDRVTRLGRFLRKTSLDELPQLLNVISGEMSLVGPRPHAIGMKTGHEESARLVADYAHRHRIKPGMTGWAAVNGSRGPLHTAADVARRVRLDIEYVERQSFWLDLWIMAITAPVLLGDRHAVR